MALTPIDTYGRPLARALLREPTTRIETLRALRTVMESEQATFTLSDVAAEVGIRLPSIEPMGVFTVATERRAPRPPRKSRGA